MRVLFLIIPFLFFACKANQPSTKIDSTSTPIVFTEISSGTNGGFNKSGCSINRTQNEFNKTWSTAFDKFSEAPKPPRIDFENEMIIIVSMGMKNSGGYTTKVNSIVEKKDIILLSVDESSPGKICATTDVITFPYQLIRLKRIDKRIEVVYDKKTYNCD